MKNIKNYLLNKLFFPKVAVIDQPGIIYNVLSRRYGHVSSKKRIVFLFEDMFAEIQKEAIAQLGKEKASELFYKIGKDFGVSFMLLGKAKKVPSFVLPEVMEFIADNFRGGGFSIAENIDVDIKQNIITFSGKNNVICRKTADPSFFAGGAAGILSLLLGKNVEAVSKCCNCPNECKVIAKADLPSKYIPDVNKLMPDKNYGQLNFPKDVESMDHLASFGKFMRFKKIKISVSGKFQLNGFAIFPAPFQITCLIMKHFEEIGRRDILNEALFRSSDKILDTLSKEFPEVKDKIKIITSLILALGWGIPDCQKKGEIIKFYIRYPPFNKSGFHYQALQLNAFLSSVFKKKLKLVELKSQENPPLLKLTYSF